MISIQKKYQYPHVFQSNFTPLLDYDILITIYICWEVLFGRLRSILWCSGKYFELPREVLMSIQNYPGSHVCTHT